MNASPTIYDEDVRLQATATATPAECECVNWCRDGLHVREEMLAGHHYRCPKFEEQFRLRALELLVRLRDNMRKWGNEEDGVPDFAWKAFCEADAVAGKGAES